MSALHHTLHASVHGLDGRLQRSGVVTHAGNRVQALPEQQSAHGQSTVYVDGSDPDALKNAVTAVGGTVTGHLPGMVRATVPTAALKDLPGRPGVRAVRPPERAVTTSVTSEGVAASGADAWQSVGTGAGVKVGVVDAGFANLAVAQASGDLPATGTGLSVTQEFGCDDVNGTDHGTAVSEIVHDMAPDAQLFLVCISDSVDLADAAAFLQTQGVSVVNMSLSFPNAGRGDGTGDVGDVIRESRQAGLLWSVSAGNEGQDHFRGRAADTNGDSLVELAGTDEFNEFEVAPDSTAEMDLRWDAWPTTTSELDIILMAARHLPTGPDDPDLLGVFGDGQADIGPLPPTTGVVIDNTGISTPFEVWALIGNFNAPSTTVFDVDMFGAVSPLQHFNAGGIGEPAASPYAMAVGAVCVKDGTVEPFSSQGPTIDGRAKPDIAAFDGVSTTTFGSASTTAGCQDGFLGTSAAAPYVTGAAALVKSANPSLDAAQIEDYLERHATSATANQTGHGTLNLGPTQVPQPRQGDTYQPLASPVRILDTRTSTGGHLGAINGGEEVTLSVPGLAPDATAIAINLTSTGSTVSTHLDVFPETYTGTSTLNLVAGQTAAVFTMVALGPNHTIKIRNQSGLSHAIVDLLGSFVPTGGSTFVAKNPPTRLLDTRTATGGHLGKLTQGETYALPVRGVAGVPADATAVILNITGVNQTTSTHLDVFPNVPNGTSTLNLNQTSLRSNSIAVAIGPDGQIRIHNFAGSVNVIADLAGWFVPSGGSRFFPLDPMTRILDTRPGNGLHHGPLTAKSTMTLQGADLYGVPYNATAVAFNLTAVSPTAQTFVTAWPTGLARPTASNINLLAGEVDPNGVVVGTGTNGTVSLFDDSGSVRLLADLYGYFAP